MSGSLWQQLLLASPLFSLIFIGYFVALLIKWPVGFSQGLTKFVFTFPLPVMLFRIIAIPRSNAPIDHNLLFAFFGGCLIIFVLARLIGHFGLKLDGVSGSVFALGAIFSNNAMLGLPIAAILLGEESIPVVAFVLIFNAAILWSLVTISVEWAKQRQINIKTLRILFTNIIKNPIIIAIILGIFWRLLALPLPVPVDISTTMIGQIASPLALIALGMGLTEHKVLSEWKISSAICILKLVVTPLMIFILAKIVNLPLLETQTIVLLGSMAVGANVYLMARQFNVLSGAVASSLVISTLLNAITAPLLLAMVDVFESI